MDDDVNGLTRRQLLQRLGAVGGGTAIYQAVAGLGMTTSVEAQTPLKIRQGIDSRIVVEGLIPMGPVQ